MKISVIVPVYNGEKRLNECVQSLVNQTYVDKEVILVDDGSTDNSGKICDDYSNQYDYIKTIHKNNEGLVIARKTGIEACRGEYFTFLDSDDYFECDCLKRIAKVTDNNPDIIFYGITDDIGECRAVRKNHVSAGFYNRNEIEKYIFPHALSYGSFFDFGIIPSMGCKAIKRSFYENADIKVNADITVGEDVDYTLQCLLKAQSVFFVDFEPYHYYKHEGTMMHLPLENKRIDALKEDLEKAIYESELADVFRKQLDDYITFLSLLKCADNVPWLTSIIDKCDSIALYGAGGFGEEVYLKFKDKISVWADSNPERFKNSELPVEKKTALVEKQNSFDCVLIAILNSETCRTVKEELIKAGVVKPIFYYS